MNKKYQLRIIQIKTRDFLANEVEEVVKAAEKLVDNCANLKLLPSDTQMNSLNNLVFRSESVEPVISFLYTQVEKFKKKNKQESWNSKVKESSHSFGDYISSYIKWGISDFEAKINGFFTALIEFGVTLEEPVRRDLKNHLKLHIAREFIGRLVAYYKWKTSKKEASPPKMEVKNV